MHYMLYLN